MMETITLKDFCSILTSKDLYSCLIRYIVNNDLIYEEVVKDFLYNECGVTDKSVEIDNLIKSLVDRLKISMFELRDTRNIEKYNTVSYKIIGENGNGKICFETVIQKSGGSCYIYIPVGITKEHNLVIKQRAIINIEILN